MDPETSLGGSSQNADVNSPSAGGPRTGGWSARGSCDLPSPRAIPQPATLCRWLRHRGRERTKHGYQRRTARGDLQDPGTVDYAAPRETGAPIRRRRSRRNRHCRLRFPYSTTVVRLCVSRPQGVQRTVDPGGRTGAASAAKALGRIVSNDIERNPPKAVRADLTDVRSASRPWPQVIVGSCELVIAISFLSLLRELPETQYRLASVSGDDCETISLWDRPNPRTSAGPTCGSTGGHWATPRWAWRR